MRNRMYGGVRGRKTKVGRKLLRFPPTRLQYHALQIAAEAGDLRYDIVFYPLEDKTLKLGDRLADNSICKLSASLYRSHIVMVTLFLEDMEDFFTYSVLS